MEERPSRTNHCEKMAADIPRLTQQRHGEPMKVVHSPRCVLHNPPYEILSGNIVEYFETPARYQRIKDALSSRETVPDRGFFEFVEADLPLDIQSSILAVHEKAYVEYVENAYEEWVKDGGDKAAVLPECFAHSTLIKGKGCDPSELPPIAKAGLYWYLNPVYRSPYLLLTMQHSSFDLSCPITADTYSSALAAVAVALTACKILIPQLQMLEYSAAPPGVFALTRPPGHHASASVCGGYCFFNNAAIAVRFLQSQGLSPSQKWPRIAILDIDYHHGNGTQEIFYEDPTVLYASLHAGQDYPYFTGRASERGTGKGLGFNLNIPLPRSTTGDDEYCAALQEAIRNIQVFDPVCLVVRTSLGVDTFADDPICDFKLTNEAYARIGRLVASLKTPTLFVMEGGYDLSKIGSNVRSVLANFLGGSETEERLRG